MATFLAFLAACACALGTVLQQKGTLETPASGQDPRFLVQTLRRPVWLAGGGLQVAGWVLQAFALKTGSLIVVQSVMATSLVIALPLGAKITNQQISRRVVTGAVAMVAGLALFLFVGSPQGGTSQPDAAAWWSAIGAAIVTTGLLACVGWRRAGAVKALLFGSAAGVAYALQAAVTKVFMTQLGHGLAALLSDWTTYTLLICAAVGFAFQQSALKTGVLAPAMAASNAVTLFGSAVFGVTVFGETLSRGDGRLTPAIIGLAAAMAGIFLLAGAKPPLVNQPAPQRGHTTAGSLPPRAE
ncbi:MAG: DMT family transporter [Actinobacteria bacterium]|nr:DMT family transporter [Actinomycetota bacterium]